MKLKIKSNTYIYDDIDMYNLTRVYFASLGFIRNKSKIINESFMNIYPSPLKKTHIKTKFIEHNLFLNWYAIWAFFLFFSNL